MPTPRSTHLVNLTAAQLGGDAGGANNRPNQAHSHQIPLILHGVDELCGTCQPMVQRRLVCNPSKGEKEKGAGAAHSQKALILDFIYLRDYNMTV